jgi:hypothetical protein
MKKTKPAVFLVAFMISQCIFSQGEKLIAGKIVVKDAAAAGVIVLNLVNEKETRSDSNGEFSIMAKPDDVLVFSAIHLDGQRKIIESWDYEHRRISIEMTSKVNELEEVIVRDYKNINAVALGILDKPAKTYTPAKRRLKTATSFSPSVSMGGMMGVAFSIDPVINWISGRTALLKSEVKVESKELLLKRLDGLYEKEYYAVRLKIPADYIKGFQYYCIGDQEFAKALHAKNQMMISFLIGMLATEYKLLLANEKK